MNFVKFKKPLYEDGAPANNAGGGSIAGIGVGPQGEPGLKVDSNKRKLIPRIKKILKRDRTNGKS